MAHLTVALSEDAVRRSVDVLVQSVAWEAQDSVEFGPFEAGYHVKGHLEGGAVDLRADNTIEIKELDIKWDKLQLSLGVDIREICVGGGCINLPWPLPDLCLPRVCIFSGDPDIQIAPDFAALVAQEISFIGSLKVRHFDASAPSAPGFDPCGFLQDVLINAGVLPGDPDTDQWQLFIDPQTIDIDLFDFADIAGDLFEDALTAAITAIIPGGWVRDLILGIIGSVADLIRFVLDIPDEIDEWLSDLFNVSFGLLDFLVTLVADFFGNCVPVFAIDDPFELMPEEVSDSVLLSGADVTLSSVLLPIEKLTAAVDDTELVVQAEVGA